ncbi:MAG: ribose 5-phosphate isomerase B [Christensenellales bacterium]|jgi:ribose 5-phosphate isomerase B
MKIAIGCDHAGFEVKDVVLQAIKQAGHEYIDFGTYDTNSCDYPDFALKAAEAVAAGKADMGILMCGTGIGISIAANKVPGIRCAHVTDEFSANAAREHNDANMLAVGSRITSPQLIKRIAEIFLNTPFAGGRHAARVNKITQIEKSYICGEKDA